MDQLDIRRSGDPSNEEVAYDGITRRVLAHTEEMMLVRYAVSEGAVFPIHEHTDTQQAVYVLEGAIELNGEHETVLEQGDSFVVGPGIRHGIEGIAPESVLIDAFSPPIDEYSRQ